MVHDQEFKGKQRARCHCQGQQVGKEQSQIVTEHELQEAAIHMKDSRGIEPHVVSVKNSSAVLHVTLCCV